MAFQVRASLAYVANSVPLSVSITFGRTPNLLISSWPNFFIARAATTAVSCSTTNALVYPLQTSCITRMAYFLSYLVSVNVVSACSVCGPCCRAA